MTFLSRGLRPGVGLVAVGALVAVSAGGAAAAGGTLLTQSFERPDGKWQAKNANVRVVRVPGAPNGPKVAHVAVRGGHASFAIRAARRIALPKAASDYTVSAWVRAASASSVGKPVTITVRQYGGGAPVRRWTSRGTLTSSFARIDVAISGGGAGRRIDVVLASTGATPGGAFLADFVSLTRVRPSAAPPAGDGSAPGGAGTGGGTTPGTGTTTKPKTTAPAPVPALPARTPAAPASPIGGLTSFRGDWETGNTSQWNVNCVAKDRLQIVTSPVRQGRYAARFEVRPGDKPSSSGERCEVYRDYHGDESAGQSYYYAWSTMVASPWVNPRNYGIFVQFHTTWPMAPALEISTQYGEFYLITRGGDRNNYDGRRTTLVPTMSPGKWNDFVMFVKWGVRDGAVKIWHRTQGGQFKVVFDKTNVPNILTDGSTASKLLLRHGYYRGSNSPGTAVVFQDGMRRAATFNDVMADFPAS